MCCRTYAKGWGVAREVALQVLDDFYKTKEFIDMSQSWCSPALGRPKEKEVASISMWLRLPLLKETTTAWFNKHFTFGDNQPIFSGMEFGNSWGNNKEPII